MAFGDGLCLLIQDRMGTTAAYSVYIGFCAGKSDTASAQNLYLGGCAGANNTTGQGNTFIGQGAGDGLGSSTGGSNTFIGAAIGTNCGSCNLAIGWLAMGSGTSKTGYGNTGVGARALAGLSSGAFGNTAVGHCAGVGITTGCNNTLIGFCAGAGITSASFNTIIGTFCPCAITTAGMNFLISWGHNGAGAPLGYILGNTNGFSLGNTAPVSGVGLHVTGEAVAVGDVHAFYSDRRLKENIIVINCALEKINSLNGIKYTPNNLAKKYNFENTGPHIGVFADEVEKVLPEAVTLAPFDTAPDKTSISGENFLTVKYERLIPLLIEGIKELDKRLSNLDNNIIEEEKLWLS